MGGDTMDCIYLNCLRNECHCHAQPLRERESIFFYKPTENELKELCRDAKKWGSCPRFAAMEEYQERQGKTEKT